MRQFQQFGAGLVLVMVASGVACDNKLASSASAGSESTATSGAPSAARAAPSGSASPSAAVDAPTAAALAEEDERLSRELQTEHRHHHTGFAGLVAMAVDTLGTSAEQGAELDKVRAKFDKKMKPIREADSAVGSVLADGVAAGAIDKAKVDAAVARDVAAAANKYAAVDEELNELHAALRPEQRAALVDKIEAEWTLWKDANARDQATESAEADGHLRHFAKTFALTDDQVTKARAAIEATNEAKVAFDTAAADAHLNAFSAAFVADTFDAKKLDPAVSENSHLVSWGAGRAARFYEAVTPILTPEQRTKVADELREHANESYEEGKP
jgi:Spy/CpxP family protein refolding chaperone